MDDKKVFIKPEADVITFNNNDIICVSTEDAIPPEFDETVIPFR